MSDDSAHEWVLKGGGETSTSRSQHLSLWQCRSCGLAATRALTARNEGLHSVLPVPEVDEPCTAEEAGA